MAGLTVEIKPRFYIYAARVQQFWDEIVLVKSIGHLIDIAL